jgi:acyl-CoA reductase-like NAD-dependent aldehyde dehydrogenase
VKVFAVRDPATDDVIAEVPDLDEAAVDAACERAAGAFPAWRDRPAHERAACLAAIAARMATEEGTLARLITS